MKNKFDTNMLTILEKQVNQRLMAALRLDDAQKSAPTLPSISNLPPNCESLQEKTSRSITTQEPQRVKVTNSSLQTKQPDANQCKKVDKEDLEFLDNLLNSESRGGKPVKSVEHIEKRNVDDEEWLDEFLGD